MRPTLSSLPVADKDTNGTKPPLSPVLGHHRAMSMSSGWPKFPTSNTPVVKDAHERGAGIFRRLSISGASTFQRVSRSVYLFYIHSSSVSRFISSRTPSSFGLPPCHVPCASSPELIFFFRQPTVSSNETANQDMNNLYRAQTVSDVSSNTLPRSRPHGRRATLSPGDAPRPRAPSPIGTFLNCHPAPAY